MTREKKSRCAYGFNCGAMMQQPGIEAEECANREVCRTIPNLDGEEFVELLAERERVRLNRGEAARMLLMMRGNPQSIESLGVAEQIRNLKQEIEQIETHLQGNFNDRYIAPTGCEAHRYNVKRPIGIYWYNKLTSKEAIFEPAIKEEKVKVIHLSKDDDDRNLLGRKGIERRNKLIETRTRLRQVEDLLREILALLQ